MTKELGITKQQADKLLDEFIKDPITKLHMLESEAIMRALAKRFGEDEENWGIIGLLHDIDWDLTKDNTAQHCVQCQEILREAGGSEFLIETIQSHGYGMDAIPALKDKERSTNLQYCLVAAETLTGLIIASTLMQPDKKLSSLTLQSLKKKFKNKGFAARCNRELIKECEKAGIPLDEFLEIGLLALQGISGKLGF
ncbi:MAG: HD domain-containing protein [Parcubacteria group bacterium]|jgi:putative nucleotidyltransferase with HDIG domain